MTFIASVVARDGVAVIADSLVTSIRPIMSFDTFIEYLKRKKKEVGNDPLILDPDELTQLFKNQPTHTKDYEDKLVKYDEYIAITTSGNAYINGKKVSEIIDQISAKLITKTVINKRKLRQG